ncbi:MAG TPA: NUDIX domain-containing protein [Gemmatimonadaceae bacterium]|nr:NUDIX domain-containing protein [Gemmatimonadaceae bacterium]
MTRIRAGVVDVYVIRSVGRRWRVLTLRRAPRTRSTGSWETVHGRIERGEKPPAAAKRELREETGLSAERLYTITVNPFYLNASDAVQLAVVFAAFVGVAGVRLSGEHDAFEWLTVARAARRFTWPREGEALAHIRKLLSRGDAAAVEDVLRVR